MEGLHAKDRIVKGLQEPKDKSSSHHAAVESIVSAKLKCYSRKSRGKDLALALLKQKPKLSPKKLNMSPTKSSPPGMTSPYVYDIPCDDAHEFLCNLLDQVQEEACIAAEVEMSEGIAARVQLTRTACPTTKNFSCIVEHELKCDYCEQSSKMRELFRHLSLDIPDSACRSTDGAFSTSQRAVVPKLQTLLQSFFQDEFFEKTCENCRFSSSKVHRTVKRLPRILVLHLKRFCMDTSGALPRLEKKHNRVSIPVSLDFGFCCTKSTKPPLAFTRNEKNCSFQPPPPASHQNFLQHQASEASRPVLTDKTNQLLRNIVTDRPLSESSFSLDSDSHATARPATLAEGSRRPDVLRLRSILAGEEDVGLRSTLENCRQKGVEGSSSRRMLACENVGNVSSRGQETCPPSNDDGNKDEELLRVLAESAREHMLLQQRESAAASRCESSPQAPVSPVDRVSTSSKEDDDLEQAIALSLAEAARAEEKENRSRGTPDSFEGPEMKADASTPARLVEVEDTSSDEEGPCGSTEYVLQAIISHLGPTATCGHFVADTFEPVRQQWFHHDDSIVSQVHESSVLTTQKEAEAYMLVYVHKDIAGRQPKGAAKSPR
eukprot:jgi/Mesen1/1555/ME000134S00669